MKPHYTRIRKVKTRSGSTAIQIGFYQGKRFKLIKHIGSAKNPGKVTELIGIAQEYIWSHSGQLRFSFNPQSEEVLFKRGIKVYQNQLTTAYRYLQDIYHQLGFDHLGNDLLKHFAMIRVLEPASKIKSIALLQKYFGITYKKTTAFRQLSQLVKLKDATIRLAINYAHNHLGFDFSLVFYDVTTLYFETNRSDDFRLKGFSKDNKINQPQILVGLMVNQTGFPVYYETFSGNTFEGHTIIPIILALKERYQIKRLTVIADAGMLSAANLSALEANGIDYVVGARIKNLNLDEARQIAQKLSQADGKIVRQGNLIYEYSAKRARKDKLDNDQQIEKAEYLCHHPAKAIRRSRFLSPLGKNTFSLNREIIEKHRLLEGIKGYKTNVIGVLDQILVNRYRDLWHVEESFRIAKSVLEARPIYHRKKTSIDYHLLIVFVALCLTRVIEQEKQTSIKKVVADLKDIWTITLKDEISGNTLEVLVNQIPH